MSVETIESQCANCGTELLGPHCYACGQPVKGMVRHFSSIIGDLFDTLLALDSRIARTLGPLLVRPGFLTSEYLAGRRVRYVSPVRLFIFLCLTAFFVARISSDWSATDFDGNSDAMAEATTVEEVERLRDQLLAEVAEAREESRDIPVVLEGLEKAERTVRQKAEKRIAKLTAKEPRDEISVSESAGDMSVCPWRRGNGECWNPEVDPIRIQSLPQSVNDRLTTQAIRANENAGLMSEDPNRFKMALFGAIPPALFMMQPFFALLLWLLYPFRRRLYMEHLIVALHSHAFLSLALLLSILLLEISAWLGEDSLIGGLSGLAFALLLMWIPLYLLLMQKRVYGQGWFLTLFKYSILGCSYLALLGIATTFALLTSLVGM